MKHLSRGFSYDNEIAHVSRSWSWPCSDQEILDLNDILLTNGIHRFTVQDTLTGRTLMEKFLQSLACYKEFAALTIATHPLKPAILDVYQTLLNGGYLDSSCPRDIEEFFLEYFYVDFMWIEESRLLKSQPWYSYVEQKLVDLHIDQQIPILKFSYT